MKILLDLSKVSIDIRCEIASTLESSEQLAILAKDNSYKVRCEVAKNKKTSLKTLEELSGDDDFEVKHKATMQIQERNSAKDICNST